MAEGEGVINGTLTFQELLSGLERVRVLTDGTTLPRELPVRLIVNGTAYAVLEVWLEPRQEGGQGPTLCIGVDPR
jgi:hypothetical protein